MTWHKDNLIFEPTEDELGKYVGFVYLITERDTGKKYIGKKFFWSKRRLPPLKGKSRKRTVVKESDWKDYYGSSEHLKTLVERRVEKHTTVRSYTCVKQKVNVLTLKQRNNSYVTFCYVKITTTNS
tara:strand:+ start:558 stop:935 length:378 start_codon:yes stop_codon:yes gene_type:complete